jgi:hypothetical protein
MSNQEIALHLALAGTRRRIAASFPPRSTGRTAFLERAWHSLNVARFRRLAGGAA